jgi:DNA-binding NtrC family response regulator
MKILLTLRDPDPAIKTLLEGHRVDPLPPGGDPSDLLAKHGYHLILLEGRMDLIPKLKAADPRAEVIFFGDRKEAAIEAITLGAADYLTLPIEIERLKEAVRRIGEVVEMRRETAELERHLTEKYTFAGIVGRNPRMLDIFSLIQRIAPYYRTVLITGQTGTGKEMIARAIHAVGPWSDRPFVVCNCGGLVEGLIESELFGHVKGSFTGAVKDKIGLFEVAGEGVLFLDEIGELPLSFQPHLLRVLQDGEFKRVGSHTTSKASCRVITATHRDLETEVAEGRFREDLFFRITPFTIKLPPLRDRKDDLPLLCRLLLNRFNKRTGKPVYGISRPAQAALMSYDWPGNVRELENVLEQAAVLTPEPFIRLEDLPPLLQKTSQDPSAPLSLEEVERRHIEMVLHQTRGNRSKAAILLGVSRRALLRRLEKFRIA